MPDIYKDVGGVVNVCRKSFSDAGFKFLRRLSCRLDGTHQGQNDLAIRWNRVGAAKTRIPSRESGQLDSKNPDVDDVLRPNHVSVRGLHPRRICGRVVRRRATLRPSPSSRHARHERKQGKDLSFTHTYLV
jgi:hypothetical protein